MKKAYLLVLVLKSGVEVEMAVAETKEEATLLQQRILTLSDRETEIRETTWAAVLGIPV